MKAKAKTLLIAVTVMLATAIVLPQHAYARVICPDGSEVPVASDCPPAGTTGSCPEFVLTFPAWYRGVLGAGTCDIQIDSILDLVKIPLNILSILIQVVAYVATGFIVWGGFKYIKSQGDPSKISEAKSAIINAVTGLAIALLSVGIVEFIQGRFS